jgi:hypothetical protein
MVAIDCIEKQNQKAGMQISVTDVDALLSHDTAKKKGLTRTLL